MIINPLNSVFQFFVSFYTLIPDAIRYFFDLAFVFAVISFILWAVHN